MGIDSVAANGAKIIQEHRVDPETRIVLAFKPGVHPWVVWHMDNQGNCYWGSYFAGIVRAKYCYNEKIS